MRANEYAGWIADYLKEHDGFVQGRCQEACEAMVAAFPELQLVRGHAVCPAPWGMRAHWWCVTPEGTIVDPTRAQFTAGVFAYEPYEEGDDVRIGTCMNCGEGIWGQPERGGEPNFCSTACHASYAAYLQGGPL